MKYFYLIFLFIRRFESKCRNTYYKSLLDIHPSVRLGDVKLDKNNISIDEGSYIRSGEIASGEAVVKIGKHCAIGGNVSIRARSHALDAPTSSKKISVNKRVYGNIVIGDYVWIGNNVFIKHGVTIGKHAIVGANSVVVNDIPERAIYAGVPARLIRHNSELDISFYE